MYFSVIRLRRDLSPKDAASLGRSDGYGLHKLVWDIFSDGPDRQRDFLYRFEKVKGLPTFYTVSEREPVDAHGYWDIHPKPYAPQLKAGDRLSFVVRVNPVEHDKKERTATEIESWRASRKERGLKDKLPTKKRIRHDIVMEVKNRIGFKNLPNDQRPHVPTLIQEAGFTWLKAREEEYGFSVEESGIRADGYCQHRLFKGKGAKPITFSTLEYNGILTVFDPDIFIERCLFKGIGPAKGFGCGLMLVKRV